jgi:hypothetical protein
MTEKLDALHGIVVGWVPVKRKNPGNIDEVQRKFCEFKEFPDKNQFIVVKNQVALIQSL